MASHPSPFHRQRLSNKTLDPTGQTAKFLYTILKQLDLKNIDWNEVASSLDITNGHAARMRWSRFRAQIEGIDNSYSRKGGKKKEGEKKRKKDDREVDLGKRSVWGSETAETKKTKAEASPGYEMGGWLEGRRENNNQVSTGFKKEATQGEMTIIDGINIHHPTVTTITVPQRNATNILDSQRATELGAHFPGGIYPSSTMENSTAERKSQQPFGASSTSHVPYRWPQQYHHLGYPQHPYRPHTTPSSYSPAPYHYSNQHSYTNTYANHPQQRYAYGQPLMLNQFQQHQPYLYPHMNSQVTNNVTTATGPSSMSIDPEIQLPKKSPLSCSPMNGNAVVNLQEQSKAQSSNSMPAPANIQIQEQACELASQASYPWPYSEVTLSQFMSQLNGPSELVANTNEQQTTSWVSNKDNQRPTTGLNFVATAENLIKHEYNSSSLGSATVAQLGGSTNLGEDVESKETMESVVTGKVASTHESSQDHVHIATGIKVEPST